MRLTLTDARGGFCISYLVDPAIAAKLAPEGAVLAPAGMGAGLSQFLTRVIQDEPQFSKWIPAAICIGRYGAASIDGKEVFRAKNDKAFTMVTSWIGVAEPLGVPGARALLMGISFDDSRVFHPLQEFGIGGEERKVALAPGEGGDTEVELKLEKAKINWVGHATGDARVETTRSMSFGYGGQRKSTWEITASFSPAETRLMVGALRVEGKDLLSRALKSSPIRAVGPQDSGGTADILFHRLASK